MVDRDTSITVPETILTSLCFSQLHGLAELSGFRFARASEQSMADRPVSGNHTSGSWRDR